MVGYLALSGKQLNDLGFPTTCQKQPTYRYFTSQLEIPYQHSPGFLGVCFSTKCDSKDMNQYGGTPSPTQLS